MREYRKQTVVIKIAEGANIDVTGSPKSSGGGSAKWDSELDKQSNFQW